MPAVTTMAMATTTTAAATATTTTFSRTTFGRTATSPKLVFDRGKSFCDTLFVFDRGRLNCAIRCFPFDPGKMVSNRNSSHLHQPTAYQQLLLDIQLRMMVLKCSQTSFNFKPDRSEALMICVFVYTASGVERQVRFLHASDIALKIDSDSLQ